MLVRIANREKSDQTAYSSSLIWFCPVYLGHFGKKLVFEILEHLPYCIRMWKSVRISRVEDAPT